MLLKNWIDRMREERLRKRVLEDILIAKEIFLEGYDPFMCNCFRIANSKYFRTPIENTIPEFTKEILGSKSESRVWWSMYDRESRIKAFDKLIEIYSK